ncbi:DUF3649 domain-containing protein [Comamonas testosteroni]|uniref:DUF3649 domain-containing protein n=1 Tax=Comamonas testosteroni TaxID=285 RepID=UPI0006B9F569|nr:DUF3649 domain-containing protein [Comamonas testosteroni]
MIPSNAAPVGAHLLSRLLAAVVGGYLLASALAVFLATVLSAPRAESVLAGMQWSFALHVLAVFLATVLSAPRAESVLAGMQWSFALHVLAVIWAFSPVSHGRVWLGLMLPACVMAAASVWLSGGG